MSETTESSIIQLFELLTRAGALGIAVLYLCGFLVVSVHLSEYGVYSVALLRGQYLAAGVLSLGPLCLTYLVVALFHTVFEGFPFAPIPSSGWHRAKHILVLIWTALWGAFKVFVLSSFFIDAFVSIFVPSVRDILFSHWRVMAWLTLQSMLFVAFVTKTWQMADRPDIHEKRGMKRTFPFAFLAACSLLFFLSYLSYFARNLYPEIPFAIGGGRPQSVVFFIKQNRDGASSPVISDQSGLRSIPYELVLETDSTYSVLSGVSAENAIQFNHDAVNGYVILKGR